MILLRQQLRISYWIRKSTRKQSLAMWSKYTIRRTRGRDYCCRSPVSMRISKAEVSILQFYSVISENSWVYMTVQMVHVYWMVHRKHHHRIKYCKCLQLENIFRCRHANSGSRRCGPGFSWDHIQRPISWQIRNVAVENFSGKWTKRIYIEFLFVRLLIFIWFSDKHLRVSWKENWLYARFDSLSNLWAMVTGRPSGQWCYHRRYQSGLP